MTTTQIDWTQLEAQLSEAAEVLREHVDAEMAEVDSALRALAEDITTQSRAALAAVEARGAGFVVAPRQPLEV
ncbi:hypothetical protein [Sporichthya polymorpha]|uniref:hypothetical protein n=1 Tax=Sporichthya polymorpha TaxID=35751 RepID=UPI000361CF8C|nr:hypothetical protein [Sporichthya polymorpha]